MSDLEHCCVLIGDRETSGNCVRLNPTTPGRHKHGLRVRTWYKMCGAILAETCEHDSLLLLAVCSAAHLERIRSVERDEISPKANTLRSEEHIARANRKSAEHRVLRVLSFLSSVSGICAVVSSWRCVRVGL